MRSTAYPIEWLRTRLPAPIISFLRMAREGYLRVLGAPHDLAGTAQNRKEPPLWLRRHAGPINAFDTSSIAALRLIESLQLLSADAAVLDIGCGPGAMAAQLEPLLGPTGRYFGVDIHGPSIRWCQARWKADSRFRFSLVGSSVDEPLPLADSSITLVIAKSLFTHLLPQVARHYLREAQRVLLVGGHAVVTAFLFRETVDAEPFFPHAGFNGAVRWRMKHRPVAAVAYHEPYFRKLVTELNLSIPYRQPMVWPSPRNPISTQDVLVIRRDF